VVKSLHGLERFQDKWIVCEFMKLLSVVNVKDERFHYRDPIFVVLNSVHRQLGYIAFIKKLPGEIFFLII
jgi:hypothetical protein